MVFVVEWDWQTQALAQASDGSDNEAPTDGTFRTCHVHLSVTISTHSSSYGHFVTQFQLISNYPLKTYGDAKEDLRSHPHPLAAQFQARNSPSAQLSVARPGAKSASESLIEDQVAIREVWRTFTVGLSLSIQL